MDIEEFPDELRPKVSRNEFVELVVGKDISPEALGTLIEDTPLRVLATCVRKDGDPDDAKLVLISGHRHDVEDGLKGAGLTEEEVQDVRIKSSRFWQCYEDDCSNFVHDTGPYMCAEHRDRLMVYDEENDTFVRMDELR